MPRRNQSTSNRRKRRHLLPEPERDVSYDSMANDLVRRGLASSAILAPSVRSRPREVQDA